MKVALYVILLLLLSLLSCQKDDSSANGFDQWKRETKPILRDSIPSENYQVASDSHVFMDRDTLRMIYTGDENGNSAIKLAHSNATNVWIPYKTILGTVGPSGLDANKETGFYRKAANGKHQIYYIGYSEVSTYEAQLFLAESNSLEGPYIQMNAPIVAKGMLAGKEVYCMTSPSVVVHQGVLYMTFIAWDNAPSRVSEVWIIGATSVDEGHTWSDFQLVDTRIGMEGQVTKVDDNKYIAVRSGTFEDREAILYSTSSHPYGPWSEIENPILVQAGPPFEKDEITAPQIFIDPETNDEILFYTGADHEIGWWIMMAKK